jgi:tRNA pseudouridine55 synthase
VLKPGSASGGVYLLDKAAGITSRKAARAVAEANGFRKYGHCGTLDPDATGLLVVILGKATRLASYISGSTKRYSFDLVTGVSTDTLDLSGRVLEEVDSSHLSTSDVVKALEEFTGIFSQKVPVFSAVRVGGSRGYKLARQGETPEMPERTVTASDWKHGSLEDGRITLEVTVSQGTYVRALARDIGMVLGVFAVADSIRRTVAGLFSVTMASKNTCSEQAMLSMAEAMRGYPGKLVPDSVAEGILHGNPFPWEVVGTATALNSRGELLAVGVGDGSVFQPRVVLVDEVTH